MNRVLIVGATSAIAEATARLWAAQGARLYLTARRAPLLEAIAADLKLRGAADVGWEALDISNPEFHEPLMSRASEFLGGLDVALIAHGTLPDQATCETSVPTMVHEIQVNGIATVALLSRLASAFEAQRKGTIVVITSVAGDRGRQSNYVYGAAKALVSTFLSGLRQRLAKAGVRVVDIRPGFVDTPMTAAMPKGALWAKPDGVARGIVRAATSGTPVVYLPWFWRWIMRVIRWMPQPVFDRIRL
jgi:decaprenylphospho-beta-D-erythro-pentofuranosid-2-ulose 2-reductase